MIVKLRDAGKPEWFLTHLFDSQPCESTFRQMRSMGTLNFTKINFTLSELFHLIERVELQNDIVYNRLAHTDIIFPRIKERVKLGVEHHVYDLPSNEELKDTLKRAHEDAKEISIEFDIYCESVEVSQCPLKKPNIAQQRQSNESDIEDDDFIENSSILDERDKLNLEENSKFIEICYTDGSKQVVRKSSIIGLLSDSTKKLSSDRLKRVQDSAESIDLHKSPKRIKLNCGMNLTERKQHIYKCDEISVGEWCIFALELDNASFIDVSKEGIIKNVIIGTVLAFQYSKGKTDKQRQYRKDTAPISKKAENDRDISVLSNWYTINTEGNPISMKGSGSFYIPINKYLATIENPRNNIQISKENLNILHDFIP